jgi:hypothetical protein
MAASSAQYTKEELPKIKKQEGLQMNTKTLYFMTRIALVAMFAMGLLGTVSAQRGQKVDQATPEMISRVLKLGTASDVSVFAENSVIDKRGSKNTEGRIVSLSDNQDATALKVRKDFSDSFSAINQLPCTQVADADLSGKTFGPGVYCMSAARLSGQIVLDGDGTFIFRVKGNLDTEKGSGISLINDAQANNVYFVADDSATIGAGTNFKGSIYARNTIVINDDATVEGKALSLKGDVSLSANAVLAPQQTGILQICKALDTTFGTGLEGRVFRFEVGSPLLVVEVVEGQCSGAIPVPAGQNLVITELLTGRTVGGSTFNGNFQLVAVNPLGQFNGIISRNLPLRQATVTVRAGGVENQTRVEFVNRFAITGIVEICKEGLDSGVNSLFSFTIAEVVDAAGNPIGFQAPTGQCTGPITVTIPSIPGGIITPGVPRTGVVNVTESSVAGNIFAGGFTLESIQAPTNRLLGVNLATRTIRAVVAEGGIANQTTIFFVNRTLAQLKVCKTAGPGVPEFTPFTFAVSGTGPTLPVNVQGPDPGTAVAAVVTVLAGTVTNPSCEVVPLNFLTDSIATITELQAAVLIPGDPTQRETRVTRIISTSGITAPVTRLPFQPYFPPQTGAAATRTVSIPVRRETTEVEFVNVAFLPVPIKVCKVVPVGSTLAGQNFTFTASTGALAEDPFDLSPGVTSATLTVTAGTNANGQNGFCDFIAGPALPGTAGVGSFNRFLPVTITETGGTAAFVATSITSPTTPGGVTNLVTRSIFLPELINGVNEVVFVNGTPAPQLPNKLKRLRMQF